MLLLDDEKSFYTLLELTPDASPQEIRAAYLRSKAAYKKDSVALYTLISEEETEDLLRKIEEAYQVLSNPDRRREYDRNHGHLGVEEVLMTRPHAPNNRKIVSIDRVPPMEDVHGDGNILVAPATDFTSFDSPSSPAASAADSDGDIFVSAPPAAASAAPTAATTDGTGAPGLTKSPSLRHPADHFSDQAIAQEIDQEVDWRGPFLRRVREARKIPLEELSDYTKISKTYLLAIEEENFPKLPASVYLRGFVTQVAKYLRLPHEKVAMAYLARVNQARIERENRK